MADLLRRRLSSCCCLTTFGLVAACSDSYVIGRFVDEGCKAHAGAIFCSGFEAPDLSDWSSPLVEGNAHVEQTNGRSYEGKGALHASSNGEASSAVVAEEFPPVTDGDLFLRAFFYVPAGLPTRTMNVLFLGDVATPDPFKGIDINLEDGAFSTYVPENDPQRFTSTTLVIPRDRWFCLRVHVAVGAGDGAVTIQVDDETALEQQGMNTLPDAGIHLLRAGIDWSSLQTEPFDFYVDGLVLSTVEVDCAG
jgi:hypothetical protein